MRRETIAPCIALAVGLALTAAVATPAHAQNSALQSSDPLAAGSPPQSGTPASAADDADDADDSSPTPASSPEAESDRGSGRAAAPRGFGESVRVDPFDVNDAEENAALQPPAAVIANPDHDVIVCMAGCDGPRGGIVYQRKKSPARTSVE